jgi:hypothetical protein
MEDSSQLAARLFNPPVCVRFSRQVPLRGIEGVTAFGFPKFRKEYIIFKTANVDHSLIQPFLQAGSPRCSTPAKALQSLARGGII